MNNQEFIQKIWREVQGQRDAEEAKRNRVRGPRDLHFAGSAEQFVRALPEFPNAFGCSLEEWRKEATEILAQYAYDIARHTIESIGPRELDVLSTEECIERIPDIIKPLIE